MLAKLNSSEWRDVPLALRDRAQFSSQVTSARLMRGVQQRLEMMASETRELLASGEEAVMDRRTFTSQLRQIGIEEGLTPEDPDLIGGLRDITSIRRLNMIYDIQTRQAEGYGRYQADLDPAALDEFPAQELVRFGNPRVPRDWPSRWEAAGGSLINGRMVALKTDPIWTAISAFGTPFPPFDFNSTMGLSDIDREEAESMGLLERDERVEDCTGADTDQFNQNLELSLREITDADPATRDAWIAHLQDSFGDQIQITGNKITWTGGRN